MSPAYHSLFVPPSAVLSLELVLCTVLFAAVFGFWLAPGGLAWALSKAHAQPKSAIPGPSGLPLLGLVFAFTGSLTHRVLAKLAESFNGRTVNGVLSRVNSVCDLDSPRVGQGDTEQLGLRGSACEGVSLRAALSPSHGVRTVRRVLEELEANFGHPLVQPETNRLFRRFPTRNRVRNGLDGLELEHLVSEGYELLGVFNLGDHFPLLGLRAVVPGGAVGDERGDFVDVLLDLESENKLSDSDMIAVLWEMIFRGTDTVAILLEWIIARMVLHPDIQAKAQSEIDSVVGKTTRTVSDSDLPNLPYVLAIVKETLRMHPPGPLLSWARLAIHDTHVGDHFIPAGTTAMVNMWAITHDERIWSEPNEYKPERFMEEDVTIMGSDLRLAPFGSGRRVCPGKAMGLVTVHLWLAQLLQSFKWLASDSGVDLSEVLKLSMEMKHPLLCKAVERVS
ncbi:cytochrome P450, family 78, subfamily A, polypeptide 5 [Actinidia rufa]|uniref:Cytochrome P450, family 78, subfamily A, polypeptide 5 n=1 Tax=Actinidia rufa TaxID=165716 RepID=A0A7J0GA80_9ERIC|nr:cytochrome P450, family 78, subfamily A, polypeptide 5 [Actinidia rufa]